ncbi:LuxS/MPP-like metallohydrolase [Sodiomyces alkalinus F11]|uniref:LuxS/MPP-like metallohydrolase n=1 Tax=Sodiomyces alkalinus (strain CBS 110278 / VKM F-3762 / F11) TaxID=1314773 RepID=A0A3N2PMX7_SODAK|nr:LuxS/MPP-like metallohydrolase [Sodiomyces alkalinus F11]ROT35881.1 LuxS/MPP-like metallohydrolase [Sodiomyces alkalinus F11]
MAPRNFDFPVPAESQSQPVEVVTDRLQTPSLDNRKYRVIRLSNNLEVLLVHDIETDKASAALDCNVGNFSDEIDMPGMAHAVEHLLFMGTKKYPVENEYSQYLAANSGSSNAYTGATSTNYFFEVSARPADDKEPSDENPSPLKGALDRFAQFFIEPLFLESTLDRELRAVDSENKKNLQSDSWRLHQLEKSLSNPNHPYCHFSTGNLEVLKVQPEARGINVREKFIKFHEKHYSANRMKMVVLGREPLDVLQAWVAEFFSAVPDKNLPRNRWEDEVPLRKSELGMQVFAKPVMDSRELNICFPFLDEEMLFETQPSRYLSHLIGHEGPGSIMAYLKSEGWANGLNAGAYSVCPGTGGIFECQIRLTEEGLKNYKKIVKVFFQYISLLKETPAQEWIFEEQKGMADVNFKFKQKTPASRFTSKISSGMQKPLPREWLLSGHSRLRKFDAGLIEQGLTCLRPDNMRFTIVSRSFPGNWDRKEKWYGTEYRYEKIPEEFLAEIERAWSSTSDERLPQLHLPHKNNFIPTKLEVEKKEVKEPALAPRIVRKDLLARTWFKKDDTFWVPKANVVVSCRNPNVYASAANAVKAKLFTYLVRDALEEYSYDAELAGLQYSVSLDARGLFLDLSGYNDKLAVLLQQVLVMVRDLEIKDDRFEIVKERLNRGYNNWELQQPFNQVSDYTSWLNSEVDYVVEEYLAELPSITAEDVRQFKKLMLSQMRIEAFVHGNVYKEDALKITEMVCSTLKPRILPQAQWPVIRSLILPPGSNYVYRKSLKDPANVNHCLETFFYVGDKGDYWVRAKTLLLDQMAHEPAFDQLRTKEQLGYVVFSGARTFSTTYGFRFIIQSERRPEYLESRIEAFLNLFATTLENMSDAEFEGHKRSLIVKRLEKLKNLDQESNRHWSHISNEYFCFDQARQDAKHIKKLTKADMIEFFNRYIKPGSPTRAQLSVHLVAQGSAQSGEKMQALLESLKVDKSQETKVKAALLRPELRSDAENLQLYLKNELKLSEDNVAAVLAAAKEPETGPKVNGSQGEGASNEGREPQVITDVRDFRASLQATPGARPVKDLSEYEDLDAKL